MSQPTDTSRRTVDYHRQQLATASYPHAYTVGALTNVLRHLRTLLDGAYPSVAGALAELDTADAILAALDEHTRDRSADVRGTWS